jgi:23S rRNA (cytosine1962-C5)-methyltransferase
LSNRTTHNPKTPKIELLTSPDWTDYELLDSGHGQKLERYGPYTFIRPEHRATWQPALPTSAWDQAHAEFQSTGQESGGRWQFRKPVERSWLMSYKDLRFRVQASAARHLGIFPEQAAHWDWLEEQIRPAAGPIRVLNLFGYTGLASLAAARAGAQVTHVDAAKRAVKAAQENQTLSGLDDRPIRWIVDDAYKFVQREGRRNSRYEGFILDPPKFGRGPDGQVWEFFKAFPDLLKACQAIISDRPLFVLVTAYAIQGSSLTVYYPLHEIVAGLGGTISCGELALKESSAGRLLSTALFTRWSAGASQR